MKNRPIHVQHPARWNASLCGMTMSREHRYTRGPGPVTCEGCRAVVQHCRDGVKLGRVDNVQGSR